MTFRSLHKSFPVLALAALLNSACSVLPPAAPAPSLHDFGALPGVGQGAAPCHLEVRVSAPPWLERGEIHYRRHSETQLSAYRDHRWIAPPSALLAARITALLGSPMAEAGPCRLEVTLRTFEQRFAPDGNSTAVIEAQGLVRNFAGSATPLSTRFHLTVDSPSADVLGGVQSLALVAGRLAEAIIVWSQNLEPPEAGRENTGACKLAY